MEKTRIKDLEANKGANVEGEIIKLDATKEVRTKFGKLTRTQKVIIKAPQEGTTQPGYSVNPARYTGIS